MSTETLETERAQTMPAADPSPAIAAATAA